MRNNDDGGLVDEPTVRERTNYIYVRVRNKSTHAYENVTVNVYLANFRDLVPGTEFLYPVDWEPAGLLDTITISSVPAASGGTEGEAIVSMPWTADRIPPAAGWHPCLLCEIIPMETTPTSLHHVFENPKLGQRNLTIIDPPPPPSEDSGGGGGRRFDGFMFVYEFAVGHPLREAKATRLEFIAERPAKNVRLFLDTAGLVDGIGEEGAQLDWDIPLYGGCVPSGKQGVQWINNLSCLDDNPTGVSSGRCDNDGLTILIKRGTEVGILPNADRLDCTLQLRFEDDVRIRVGGERTARGLESRYRLKGMRPVVLNGLPLLEVTDAKAAALTLSLKPGRKRLRLIGIVTGEPAPEYPLYHISERLGDHTIGGVSLQIGA